MSSSRKASFRSRTPARCQASPRRRKHAPSVPWPADQQKLADVILQDEDVDSLSSFIGVDGSNNTLNSGRLLINLKPRDDRTASASDIIRRLERRKYGGRHRHSALSAAGAGPDHRFDGQPRAISVRPGEPGPGPSSTSGSRSSLARLNQLPEFADVASDLQQQGKALDLTIDRATAARFGITPATVDNALYDAFGQRIVSTLYHPVEPVSRDPPGRGPGCQVDTAGARWALPAVRDLDHDAGAAVGNRESDRAQRRRCRSSHLGQFPSTTISFNLAADASLGQAVAEIDQAEKDIGLPDSFITAYQGALSAFQASLSNELMLIVAALVAVYVVLGVLYESFVHPITILSTLPSAGVGALLALQVIRRRARHHRHHRHHPIDRHREEERDHDDRLRAGRRTDRGQASARRDLSGLLAAVPPDPDDDHGGALRRLAADAGSWHRFGTAPAARHRHRRRPDRQPGADAVHHAGDLSGVRRVCGTPGRPRRWQGDGAVEPS